MYSFGVNAVRSESNDLDISLVSSVTSSRVNRTSCASPSRQIRSRCGLRVLTICFRSFAVP